MDFLWLFSAKLFTIIGKVPNRSYTSNRSEMTTSPVFLGSWFERVLARHVSPRSTGPHCGDLKIRRRSHSGWVDFLPISRAHEEGRLRPFPKEPTVISRREIRHSRALGVVLIKARILASKKYKAIRTFVARRASPSP